MRVSDFYGSINDILDSVHDIEMLDTLIENIELSDIEESATGEKLDESVRQYAIKHYKMKHYKMKRNNMMEYILNICGKIAKDGAGAIEDDGCCAGFNWTLSKN